ncbi:MAG TPA: serine hydrolase domain-containing protein [Rhodanobacter sp.]|nr:serine hydrolase domain-containing protein [Rhodanobacter sp.]
MSGVPDFARIGNELSRGLVAAGAFGGSVALVLREHGAVFTHGEAQAGLAVTPATPFHICSCSKTFTAAVFSRLVQDGAAAWDRPIHEVVPEFGFDDPWTTRHCTFRDLATQRTGLTRDGIAEWGIRQDLPKETRLARARHMDFSAPFRDRFSYSNLGYIALSLAAERLAGRPYPTLVQDLICTPLAMSDSFSAGFGAASLAHAAMPHLPIAGRPTRVRDLTGPNSEGSARMYLSGRDAGRWLRFLLAALAGSDAGPLSSATVRAMAAAHTIVRDPDIRMAPQRDAGCAYGMGLFATMLHGRPLLRHGGGGRGWRHAMALAPTAQAGVMLMASAESPAVDGLALQLLEMLIGEAPRDWGGLFSCAADAAAVAERHAIEARFPADAGTPASFPVAGRYGNPVTGEASIDVNGSQVRIVPADAPDFTATLRPLGGGTFAFDFDEPALAPQPLDPPFRLRVSDTAAVDTSYFGRLGSLT